MSELHPAWLVEAPVRRLLAAFETAGIEVRFVGGCVRDALLGVEGGDIDVATPARPDAVMAALAAAKVKAVPTGLAHGTVTAVIAARTFEITTLRRDVETDGRHAIVAFDAGWTEDAARRDFTINAIYLTLDGTLDDPVGGIADLRARRVRFVGDPATRIAEDVLRVLRYYRFEARFGAGEGDASARAACRAATGRLPALSAERVSRELLRLMAGPDPVRALKMMHDDGVLAAILPEATRLDRLVRLLTLDTPTPALPRRRGRGLAPAGASNAPPPPLAGEGWGGGSPDDALLRLAALIDIDRARAAAVAERLRLPAKDRKRLTALAKPWPFGPEADAQEQRLALYRVGRNVFADLLILLASEGQLSPAKMNEIAGQAGRWTPPAFPLKGDDVTALGIAPGPLVGRLLAEVRRWWEGGDFTADRAACLAKLNELAARTGL